MTGTHETLLVFSDLMGVIVRGDDVLGFDTSWDSDLFTTQEVPCPNSEKRLKNSHHVIDLSCS